VRITKIEIKDFRGFPGDYIFDLKSHGKNLLVYGENGSGKSSLFHALDGFLQASRNKAEITVHKNIFSKPGEPLVKLEVVGLDKEGNRLPESGSYEWSEAASPAGQPMIEAAAKTRGCLDYKALLRTHYVHLEFDRVDLFELLIDALLPHYENPITRVPFKEEWQNIRSAVSGRLDTRVKGRLVKQLEGFNDGLANVLGPLEGEANKLLTYFDRGVSITLRLVSKASLKSGPKELTAPQIHLSVDYAKTAIPAHHRFLNEERLSAIALAVYFASLLLYPASALRVLVLDDVLIGLDMSNRLPVLDILRERFAEWQIILLTHDKVWYELVWLQTENGKDWCYLKLFCQLDPEEGFDRPTYLRHGEGAADLLVRAREHLASNDERAAALYARLALEVKLKRYCDKNGVPVAYNRDPRKVQAQAFWDAVRPHAFDKYRNDAAVLASLESSFASIEALRKVVLNPLSHSGVATVVKAEVKQAIDVVDGLSFPKLDE